MESRSFFFFGSIGNIFPMNIWVFPKIEVTPQIIHLNRVFHYKPSILGYPYFWKHPFETKNGKRRVKLANLFNIDVRTFIANQSLAEKNMLLSVHGNGEKHDCTHVGPGFFFLKGL